MLTAVEEVKASVKKEVLAVVEDMLMRVETVLADVEVDAVPAADAGFRRGGGGGHACGRDPKYSQLGGMGERCELPHRGLGQSPRSQRFLHFKTFQNYVKIMII